MKNTRTPNLRLIDPNTRLEARRSVGKSKQSHAALAQLAEQRFCKLSAQTQAATSDSLAKKANDGAAGTSPSPRTPTSLAGETARRTPGFFWLSRVLR